jgi:hypothetical protein
MIKFGKSVNGSNGGQDVIHVKKVDRQTQNDEEGDEDGARSWAGIMNELRYAKMGPRGWQKTVPRRGDSCLEGNKDKVSSLFISISSGDALATDVPSTHWVDTKSKLAERILREQRRITDQRREGRLVLGEPSWAPIGPSAILKGLASGRPPVSGRVLRMAISSGGQKIYIATAGGGVWRSSDAGATWVSTMDGIDQDPTSFASTSIACGAVAIDVSDPNRVYVGTGEADTYYYTSIRLRPTLPSYNGIGPLRSDNGGETWISERTASTSTPLAGAAFFELAVDRNDREKVVAATTSGLYLRAPDGTSGYNWVQKRPGVHTSVVSCHVGRTTTFFAASSGVGVFSSSDGSTWTPAGTRFPAGTGRISLGARDSDPSILYAFVAASGLQDTFLGLYRLDGGSGPWRIVANRPDLGSQASYNLAITVDPNQSDLLYLAGQFFNENPSAPQFDAAIFRCQVASSGSGTSLRYSMTHDWIGKGSHSDIHALQHAPGDSSTLWSCSDGGMFQTATALAPIASPSDVFFEHRNTGLATLCGLFFSQHPTQPAVVVLGLQDNGVALYTGEECWSTLISGDGGHSIINWASPEKMLVVSNGRVFLTENSSLTADFRDVSPHPPGQSSPSWYSPLAGPPYKPTSPSEADVVAFGWGAELWISTDFATNWTNPYIADDFISAITFASSTRFYIGTTLGQIVRFDLAGSNWKPSSLDDPDLEVSTIVTDIEADPADSSGSSIYITFAGIGSGGVTDQRHVWYFDGTPSAIPPLWHNRSGSGSSGLLDVETNALVVDPNAQQTLYVGCDVGVWRSTDSGLTWAPFESGLPDAPVFDLQIHPTVRSLLRASTYGRGMFEYKLDPPAPADVELYIRDTTLDLGRGITIDGIEDPEQWPRRGVLHYFSRNIKVDVPTTSGYQSPTFGIDFVFFNGSLIDDGAREVRLDAGRHTVINRVYVEVHNRGSVAAKNTRIMLLLANASVSLPQLPPGYESNVKNGLPINTGDWRTVDTTQIDNVQAGFPQVVGFNLPSIMLAPPATPIGNVGQSHYCLLALLHNEQDGFSSTDVNIDAVTIADRKVAQHNLAFVFLPSLGHIGRWARFDLRNNWRDERQRDLLIDMQSFRGRLVLLLPSDIGFKEVEGLQDYEKFRPSVREWSKTQTESLQVWMKEGRFNYAKCREMVLDIGRVTSDSGGRLLLAQSVGQTRHLLRDLQIQLGKRYPVFVYLEADDLKPDETQVVNFELRDAKMGRVEGGCRYQIALEPKGQDEQ